MVKVFHPSLFFRVLYLTLGGMFAPRAPYLLTWILLAVFFTCFWDWRYPPVPCLFWGLLILLYGTAFLATRTERLIIDTENQTVTHTWMFGTRQITIPAYQIKMVNLICPLWMRPFGLGMVVILAERYEGEIEFGPTRQASEIHQLIVSMLPRLGGK